MLYTGAGRHWIDRITLFYATPFFETGITLHKPTQLSPYKDIQAMHPLLGARLIPHGEYGNTATAAGKTEKYLERSRPTTVCTDCLGTHA